MELTQLKRGDKVRVTKLSALDVQFTDVQLGDLLTVHAGLGEVVLAHEDINEAVHGEPNHFGVVMAFSESGEGFLISEENEVELVLEGE